jgi:hypothetical protein
VHLEDVPSVDTPAAHLSVEVATRFHVPALLNHCARSYLFAASLGVLQGVAFDAELLYVAAMLHDIGLVADFDSHTAAFETAGASVAWVFAAGAGWPEHRRTRTSEIIERHMWQSVDPAFDTEGHLLEVATSLDISGAHPDSWPAALRAEIVDHFPRLDLGVEFTRCFQDQARRKPNSAAARSVGNGIAERIRTNPLESL